MTRSPPSPPSLFKKGKVISLEDLNTTYPFLDRGNAASLLIDILSHFTYGGYVPQELNIYCPWEQSQYGLSPLKYSF